MAAAAFHPNVTAAGMLPVSPAAAGSFTTAAAAAAAAAAGLAQSCLACAQLLPLCLAHGSFAAAVSLPSAPQDLACAAGLDLVLQQLQLSSYSTSYSMQQQQHMAAAVGGDTPTPTTPTTPTMRSQLGPAGRRAIELLTAHVTGPEAHVSINHTGCLFLSASCLYTAWAVSHV
jgi:hypothetical protein